MSTQAETGRVNQKRRTREAILHAARELVKTGGEVSMPLVARAALVSEATAYRYFPDLPSLIQEALVEIWPDPAEALADVRDSTDPAVRIACATEILMRGVLAYEGATRASIGASITRSEIARKRPGFRFGLIDEALAPLSQRTPRIDNDLLIQLKRDLALIISAEALFTLTDVCGLSPDDAIATAVHTASTLTRALTQQTSPHSADRQTSSKSPRMATTRGARAA
jgi:AcrR family transcriptional regulator